MNLDNENQVKKIQKNENSRTLKTLVSILLVLIVILCVVVYRNSKPGQLDIGFSEINFSDFQMSDMPFFNKNKDYNTEVELMCVKNAEELAAGLSVLGSKKMANDQYEAYKKDCLERNLKK